MTTSNPKSFSSPYPKGSEKRIPRKHDEEALSTLRHNIPSLQEAQRSVLEAEKRARELLVKADLAPSGKAEKGPAAKLYRGKGNAGALLQERRSRAASIGRKRTVPDSLQAAGLEPKRGAGQNREASPHHSTQAMSETRVHPQSSGGAGPVRQTSLQDSRGAKPAREESPRGSGGITPSRQRSSQAAPQDSGGVGPARQTSPPGSGRTGPARQTSPQGSKKVSPQASTRAVPARQPSAQGSGSAGSSRKDSHQGSEVAGQSAPRATTEDPYPAILNQAIDRLKKEERQIENQFSGKEREIKILDYLKRITDLEKELNRVCNAPQVETEAEFIKRTGRQPEYHKDIQKVLNQKKDPSERYKALKKHLTKLTKQWDENRRDPDRITQYRMILMELSRI
jgi:hypothetical protein